ncbi:MAG: hypothetical protein VXZ15_03320 [Planctomycetota bacterium]|nr:hypothetical protein [Planctomycetota bacterium]
MAVQILTIENLGGCLKSMLLNGISTRFYGVYAVTQLILNCVVFPEMSIHVFASRVTLPNWVELAAISFQYEIPHSSRIYIGF